MIQLIEITHPESESYRLMEQLLVDSFAEDEYRDLNELRQYTASNPLFHANMLINSSGNPVGLLNYWDFDGWVYIEHFATFPAMRNGGIGREALAHFSSIVSKPVIIEVEEPVDEMSKRRVGFYSRNGFELLPDRYIQPAYKPGSSPLEMKIMVNNNFSEAPDFPEIASTLHSKVYGVKVSK